MWFDMTDPNIRQEIPDFSKLIKQLKNRPVSVEMLFKSFLSGVPPQAKKKQNLARQPEMHIR
jgi:hypothetical protein